MTLLVRGGGRLLFMASALASGVCLLFAAPAAAGGNGPPGVQPGFQGFGLGFHPGRGYGGDAWGVGPWGGYPFYGGPGYPSHEPALRRRPGLNPFPYFGGPGYPTAGHPNYYGNPGPLVAERPVVKIGDGNDSGYGCFTGGPPNAEAVFAPFTTIAAQGGSSSGVMYPPTSPNPSPAPGTLEPPPSTPSPLGTPPTPSGASRPLGIDTEPVVGAGGNHGLKVSGVRPGTEAERLGLRTGDVIQSINGRPATHPDHLTRATAGVSTGDVLKLSVRNARDGEVRTVTARLP